MAKWHYVTIDTINGNTYYMYQKKEYEQILKEGSHEDYDECDYLMDHGYTYESRSGIYVFVPTPETALKELMLLEETALTYY